jgi:hypothetical protein
MKQYKGITFAKDYNKSFAEFKEAFGSLQIFKNIPPKERAKELSKAYSVATDGKLSRTTSKDKKSE